MRLPRTTTGKYSVEAVMKALDVLEAFDTSDGLSLGEIGRRVGLNKSRTYRLVQTLADRGYLQRNADGSKYRLATKLLERAAYVHRNIKDLARDSMLQLQERFNETVNLSVLDDTAHVLYVDIVESSRPFRMIATIGCRLPSHVTAMGKAMLALMRIDDPKSPHRAAAAKLPSSRNLDQELASIRQRGYAIDNEENEPGVGCVGAAILDANGRPIAAMSVSGPVQRILSNEHKIAAELVTACEQISANLGFNSAATSAKRTQPLQAHSRATGQH